MNPFDGALPFKLIHLPEVDSTNNYLSALCQSAETVEEFTVVAADFQLAGKGQRGNSWEAERGANLLFSVLLRPQELPADRQFLLSQIVSLSIKKALDVYTSGISIKWPNDIYWQDKKICGILIENTLQGGKVCESIAGIGLNVNQGEFAGSAPNPVSLTRITGREINRAVLLLDILRNMHAYYLSLEAGEWEEIRALYLASLYRLNIKARYVDAHGEFNAQIVDVETSGLLVLRNELGKERRYAFKEVSFG